MTPVLIAAIAVLSGLVVTNYLGDAEHRRKTKRLTADVDSLQELRSMHISNDRIIKAMEKNPFITSYREALSEWDREDAARQRELKARAEYDDLTAKLGNRDLAARVIAAFPIPYGKREGASLNEVVSEFLKYSDDPRSSSEGPVKNAILGLLAAGFIKKGNYSWKEKRVSYGHIYYDEKNEIRYWLRKSKENTIDKIIERAPTVREAIPKPQVEDYIDAELAKQWVEEAQIELLEEELHHV